jgi:uncharacterized protein YuzE
MKKTFCHEQKIRKNTCYVSFVNPFDKVDHSSDAFITARGERMVIDFDKKGRVVGIELLNSKTALKRCQQ